MDSKKYKNKLWQRRKRRVRKKVSGEADRPRLTVFRSNRNIYAQVVDDSTGVTLVSASTMSKDFAGDVKGNKDAAGKVGAAIARKALDVGIHQVRFDRNGYKYHGRVAALAAAARESGLAF